MVVHVQRTVTKDGIAMHYCSLGMVVHVQTDTINLRIPYKCIVMQKYLASFTDVPYMVGTVNHTKKNETGKITVTTYMAGTVNHAMNNEMAKITDTI